MTHNGGVFRPTAEPDHIVQLFDSIETLAPRVARYLFDGYQRGESLLVAATAPHWAAIAALLEARGCPTGPAIAEGQLTVLDAHTALDAFMVNEDPDRVRFQRVVDSVVRRLSGYDRGLRIYGEMVDVLAAAGNYRGAQLLEELWNALAVETPFTLFCGYSSVHFGDSRTGAALGAICGCHTHVEAGPLDELGAFLLAPYNRRG